LDTLITWALPELTEKRFFGPIQCGPSERRIEDSRQVAITQKSDGLRFWSCKDHKIPLATFL